MVVQVLSFDFQTECFRNFWLPWIEASKNLKKSILIKTFVFITYDDCSAQKVSGKSVALSKMSGRFLGGQIKGPDSFRTAATLQNCAHVDMPLKMPLARQNPPKKYTHTHRNPWAKRRISSFHQRKPSFLRGTLYFSSCYLKDLAKIFLLARFENILMTFQYKEAMVSGSGFQF